MLVMAVCTFGAAAPAVSLVVSCIGPGGDCDPTGPLECVATCGGPVVQEVCGACPPGLIANIPVQCTDTNCGEVVWEGCDQCPEGLIDVEDLANTQVSCVEGCDGSAPATYCATECPPGTFAPDFCSVSCPHALAVCVDQCGGRVEDVTCDSCHDEGLVDRITCSDAGVADGDEDAGESDSG